MKGRLIVLDGTDGSGKATQARLLLSRLKDEGYKTATIDFPHYKNYSAEFVKRYLKGEYGPLDTIDAYKGSIFYAVDRFAASHLLKSWLYEGRVVVCDRYVSSNMGHQGCKIDDPDERQAFFEWLYDLEYNKLGIPKPDLSILLYMPYRFSHRLASGKWKDEENKAHGMGKEKDIHEKSKKHLLKAEEAYLTLAKTFPHWERIDCFRDQEMLSKEEIAEKVWDRVKKTLAL